MQKEKQEQNTLFIKDTILHDGQISRLELFSEKIKPFSLFT